MTGRDSAPSSTVELCAFRVGDEEYVIDLRRIREIVQPLPVTPVPHAPEFVEGVIDLRGEVVPLVDVRRRLGLPPRSTGARPKMLIVNLAGRALALLVDGVTEVVRIPRSAIGPPPALLAAGRQRLFLGVCAGRSERSQASSGRRGAGPARRPLAGRLRLLLDVKALLRPSALAGQGAGDPGSP
jgi:purine-binding chemotaxis protein CheW